MLKVPTQALPSNRKVQVCEPVIERVVERLLVGRTKMNQVGIERVNTNEWSKCLAYPSA
jgi:hypothetical protein